jgi:acetate kinase
MARTHRRSATGRGPASGSAVRVLVVNVGSSSLKLRLLDPHHQILFSRDFPVAKGGFDAAAVGDALTSVADDVDVVGHRIVHGGTLFRGPVRIDAEVEQAIRGLADLAPLHQRNSLAGLDLAREHLPDIRSVACFDTAFHASMPAAASTYAVPREWRERHGVRRYGFHGLSHAYASRRTAEMVGRGVEDLRVVTCHLGAGASLAAVRGGRSVDTTMGFTPLEGLVMATRSGTVDPGLAAWLVGHGGLGLGAVMDGLEHSSGLLALAGSSDMAAIEARAGRGQPEARLALDVYLHRLRAGIASMASAMDGLDAVAFTGGVGEHSAAVRSGAAAGLGFLGIVVDETANDAATGDGDVTREGASVRTVVIQAREDLEIARQVRGVMAAPGTGR